MFDLVRQDWDEVQGTERASCEEQGLVSVIVQGLDVNATTSCQDRSSVQGDGDGYRARTVLDVRDNLKSMV